MKKYLVFAAVLTLLVLVAGCDLLGLGSETWSYSVDVLGLEYCVEVTTSNADLKAALDDSGLYTEEPCDIDSVGSCTITDMAGYASYDAEWVFYYGGEYDAAAGEAACDILDGEWNN